MEQAELGPSQARVTFGLFGAVPVHDVGGHSGDAVNRDGLTDLVSHYQTRETGIALGDTEACLTGETLGGISFEACDSVQVYQAHKKKKGEKSKDEKKPKEHE